ncbi:MAG: class I SAM-dependent methyltransferase [Motiliproteus sp.]|nr:class I SAM-dependent methyltransferase [Motiliproteus sp.]MCW9051396.1 class I SAM-dependent methyltransferase [Motiliproteus sp.]
MKLTSGHFESNSQPILSVLQQELKQSADVLEVASGYGQHADFFCQQLPGVSWQPSELNVELLPSIVAYAQDSLNQNLKMPIILDACGDWEVDPVDAIISINLLHVSPKQACSGLLRNAGKLLNPEGLIFFYGPFIRPDVETAASNLMFNQRLKSMNPDWGIPELTQVTEEAADYGIELKSIYELPANNVIVVLKK